MKFIIKRTSGEEVKGTTEILSRVKPDVSYQTVVMAESRIGKDPDWYNTGCNHRTVFDEDSRTTFCIKEEEIKVQSIELNSLEELLQLKEEVDEEIIINHQFKYGLDKYKVSYPTIEIYDDYRE